MPRHTCAQLLDQGDRAHHDRDREALARVALELAARVGDPHRDALRDLATSCQQHRRVSARAWPALRVAIAERIAIAGT